MPCLNLILQPNIFLSFPLMCYHIISWCLVVLIQSLTPPDMQPQFSKSLALSLSPYTNSFTLLENLFECFHLTTTKDSWKSFHFSEGKQRPWLRDLLLAAVVLFLPYQVSTVPAPLSSLKKGLNKIICQKISALD